MPMIGIIGHCFTWDGLAMPRRATIDRARLDALLALPDGEADVVRHYTLTAEELAHVARRRRPHNRLGFALQLCALRYPGRVIRPGEAVPGWEVQKGGAGFGTPSPYPLRKDYSHSIVPGGLLVT